MNRESEPLQAIAPARNLLCDAALGATALTGALYLSDALAAHSSWSFGVILLAICPVIVLAARRGGGYLLVLGLLASLFVIWLEAAAFNAGSHLGHDAVAVGLFVCSLLACCLQLALMLQILEKRRPQHNSWRRETLFAGTFSLVMFAALLLIHRPEGSREWWEHVRMVLIFGVVQLVFVRYFSPIKPGGPSWREVFRAVRATRAHQRPPRG